MYDVSTVLIKTPVTCVKYYSGYILAGIGNELHIYSETGELLRVHKIFKTHRVFGIFPNSHKQIAVFGIHKLALIKFDESDLSIKITLIKGLNDWILYAQWIDSDKNLALIFGGNHAKLLNNEFKVTSTSHCVESVAALSGIFLNNAWENVYILTGTLLSTILLWKPDQELAPVLMEFCEHSGSIFSLAYNSKLNTIASVSDNRTVYLWHIEDRTNEEDFNHDKCRIVYKHSMFGHTSRIFRCIFAGEHVISAAQDGFIHIWDVDGKLIRKFYTHQGGSVWALDYCESKESIISGGRDCGISMYTLKSNNMLVKLPHLQDMPKCLALTATDNVVIVTDMGRFIYYKMDSRISDVHQHDDLKNYAVLTCSHSRDLFALAGISGSIHIYKEESDSIRELCSAQTEISTRVYSAFFLNMEELLTSLSDTLYLWILKSNEGAFYLELDKVFKLPLVKEPWITAAAKCFGDKIAVSDRKGNIYLYTYESQRFIHIVRNAHCYLGVDRLLFDGKCLISCGRDGYMNEYTFEENTFTRTKSNKLPLSWICDRIKRNDASLLIGFSGNNFIIYDYKNRELLKEISCGGGHRSWSFSSNSSSLSLIYIRRKDIYHFSTDWPSILGNNILPGFHRDTINAAKVISLPDENKYVVVTGGEDTICRLSLMDLNNSLTDIKVIETLKVQLSSIRCILVTALDETSYYIFCGGGRSHLTLHKLEFTLKNNEVSEISCKYLSYNYGADTGCTNIRIMDLTFVKNKLLVTGCSSGELQYFRITPTHQIQFIGKSFLNNQCIFKLDYISIENKIIVLTATKDGKLTLWDFTEIFELVDQDTEGAQICDLKSPILAAKLHESDVNTLSVQVFDNKIVAVTGGDDNTVLINVIEISNDSVSVSHTHTIRDKHFTRITGVAIKGNLIISASTDHCISVTEIEFRDGELILCSSYRFSSSITDTQGMELIDCKDKLRLLVYGDGLQVLQFSTAT